MEWHTKCVQETTAQAWKNGGGQTRELVAWPNATEWIVRISVADIDQDGPFSGFEHIQRWFAVLQGAGVRLFDDEREIRAGDALLEFDGALAPACTLIEGSTRDFNLMHRRNQGKMTVDPVTALPYTLQGEWIGLFTANGGVFLHDDHEFVLQPMSLSWVDNREKLTCSFQGDGPAWWMSWKSS